MDEIDLTIKGLRETGKTDEKVGKRSTAECPVDKDFMLKRTNKNQEKTYNQMLDHISRSIILKHSESTFKYPLK